MVTFDAPHTVRANLNWLAREKKGHYIAVVKRNQPLLYARVKALPWRQVPAGSVTRDTGHGRVETRTLKSAHVSRLDFRWALQARDAACQASRQGGSLSCADSVQRSKRVRSGQCDRTTVGRPRGQR